MVLVRRCRTCCPRRSKALREIRFPPPGAIPTLPPSHPPTLCCWHSHANSSPLVITLPSNQLTTTAGVRLLTAHCRMVGWRDESECVCVHACDWMHLYAFIEGALILPLLVLHKTVVIDDDTLSVLLPKTASHNLP